MAMGLGIPNILTFESSPSSLLIASTTSALPILVDSADPSAIHIAVATFAKDIWRVTGVTPLIYKDRLPDGTAAAIIAVTVGSKLLKKRRTSDAKQQTLQRSQLEGKWEAFEVEVVESPLPGLEEGLVLAGSDKVGPKCRAPLTAARPHLRALRDVGDDGSVTMVLVGRCSNQVALVYQLSPRCNSSPWRADREISRLLSE